MVGGGGGALRRGSQAGARIVHSETHTNTFAGELERQAEDKWKILEYN